MTEQDLINRVTRLETELDQARADLRTFRLSIDHRGKPIPYEVNIGQTPPQPHRVSYGG